MLDLNGPKTYLILIICLFAVFVGGMIISNNRGYDAGYAAKTNEYQKAFDKALEYQKKDYEKALAEAANTIRFESLAEIERVKQSQTIKIKEVEVVKYVDREIKVPATCTEFARNINRVLYDATRNVAEVTRSYPTNTGGINDAVSEFQF